RTPEVAAVFPLRPRPQPDSAELGARADALPAAVRGGRRAPTSQLSRLRQPARGRARVDAGRQYAPPAGHRAVADAGRAGDASSGPGSRYGLERGAGAGAIRPGD